MDPNVKDGDFLDIRPYVKMKLIPGGSRDECRYVDGIVFRKNVTHKTMPRCLQVEVLLPLWFCCCCRRYSVFRCYFTFVVLLVFPLLLPFCCCFCRHACYRRLSLVSGFIVVFTIRSSGTKLNRFRPFLRKLECAFSFQHRCEIGPAPSRGFSVLSRNE